MNEKVRDTNGKLLLREGLPKTHRRRRKKSDLNERLEVRIGIVFFLKKRGSVELATAEPDVGVEVGYLLAQDVADHNRRVLVSAHLAPDSKCSEFVKKG